jgi:hypothetical protein
MVTSRATGDDLIEDDDPQPADITATPRQSSRKPAAAKPGSAKPGSAKTTPSDETQDVPAKDAPVRDVKANGGPAAKGGARPAPVDATVIDGIPALPADTIGSARGTKPRETKPAAASFGPPPTTPAKPALEDPTIAYPAETAAKPSGDAPAPSSTVPPSGLTSTSSATAGSASSAPPATEASSMPPAAFAWEMPDPPPDSPSSPARAFLRSGLTAKNPAPSSTPISPSSTSASASSTSASAPPTARTPRTAPAAPAGKPAEAPSRGPAKNGPVTLGPLRGGPAKGGPGSKAQQKAQSKKSARQAHLTVSRVEPWSVMKFSFVVSLVAFVILFVAVSVLYGALSGLGVFDSLQRVVSSLTSSQGSTGVNAKAWFSASRILGYTALLGSLNIVLITAMSTIGSVVYNLTSRLVGGVEVTLRETE